MTGTTSSVPTIDLNNGVRIPQLGFGVFQIEPENTVEATTAALEIGYRHIDTAEMYGNEKEVGEAIRRSGLDRGEVFVTSKLNNGFHRRDDALRAFDGTLEALGFDQLDLFLIHWPLPGIGVPYVETWKALEEIYASGRTRAIGRARRFSPRLPGSPAGTHPGLRPWFTRRCAPPTGRGRRRGPRCAPARPAPPSRRCPAWRPSSGAPR